MSSLVLYSQILLKNILLLFQVEFYIITNVFSRNTIITMNRLENINITILCNGNIRWINNSLFTLYLWKIHGTNVWKYLFSSNAYIFLLIDISCIYYDNDYYNINMGF